MLVAATVLSLPQKESSIPPSSQPSSALSELAILVLSQIEIENWHYESWGKDFLALTFSTSALLEPSMNQRFWKKENGTGQRIMKLQYLCNQPPIPSLDHSPCLFPSFPAATWGGRGGGFF